MLLAEEGLASVGFGCEGVKVGVRNDRRVVDGWEFHRGEVRARVESSECWFVDAFVLHERNPEMDSFLCMLEVDASSLESSYAHIRCYFCNTRAAVFHFNWPRK